MKVNIANIETESKDKFNNNIPKVKAVKENFIKTDNIKKGDINSNNNNSNKKNKIIIFVIIASILLVGIFIILYLKIFKNLINEINSEKTPTTLENQDNDIILNNTFNTPLETPLKNIISGYTYEEIESKIGFPIIYENNKLLNDTINNINDYIILNDSDIKIITNISEIVYSPPDYLINPTKNYLKIVKSDIIFYKSKFEELSKYIYNFTRNASELINNIYYLLNNTKEELNNLLYQFKENIKNISIPFILEQGELINKNEKNKKNISLFDEMEDYKNETNNLNYLYNNLFKYINEEIQIIFYEINEVKKFYLDLQRNIEDVKEIFISKLEEFNKDEDNIKYHEILIQMKNLFISIKEDIINKKIQFKEKMNSLEIQRGKIDLEDLKKIVMKLLKI